MCQNIAGMSVLFDVLSVVLVLCYVRNEKITVILKPAHTLLGMSLLTAAAAAHAQSACPNRFLRMVVPSSAGGGSDIAARIVAPRLAERLGQQVVIDINCRTLSGDDD